MEKMTPFHKGIQANLGYWKEQTQTIVEATQQTMAMEYGNLYQAIEYGLHLPQTVISAIELLIQSLACINRHGKQRKWIPLYQQALTVCPEGKTNLQIHLLLHLGSAY
ncbi:MAG: hypothetical protein KAG66_21670, partial [Methylococcales bacterium]|nr:hypothetical protein [Methylococcales bacterium]